MSKRLAIISSHPIQYYAPVFKLLAKVIDLKVFYTWGEESMKKYDQGFKQQIEWDLPLLEGYEYCFLKNIAKEQGTHHFKGIINPTLIKEIQTYAPNAILVYGWAWHSHLKVIRYFKGKIPVLFRGDSTVLNKQANFTKLLKKLFLKWVYKHIDKAFYVGTANKDYFKTYGLKEEQLSFAPHAIDNERFGANRFLEAQKLRGELGISEDGILVLFAGKLETIKNPGLLLEAFIEVSSSGGQRPMANDQLPTSNEQTTNNGQGPNLHLLFVGNGELEESLKLKVESFDYPQDDKHASTTLSKTNIHFMDFQNQTQMPVVYQTCDLFCLPSKSETWGLAVNEAMAAGKAILVSDKVGCAADLVTPANGLIFKNNDLNDLKQKLIALTQDKTTLVERGKSAQKHIQNWSFGQQVKAILKYVNR